eukprot:m.12976 g.12976  ORF g.12976 m.12976 type:complete len:390 (-) comp5887_c0_seq1:1191-2360(-)
MELNTGHDAKAQARAALVVQRTVRAWYYHTVFQRLKQALHLAEQGLSVEILRQLRPREAELFDDPFMQPLLRFRLDGTCCPPEIVFKVFLMPTGKMSVVYLTGKNTITALSGAAEGACAQMGAAKYMEQVYQDYQEHMSTAGVSSTIDVANERDKIKLQGHLDKLSPEMGGRSNDWRRITEASALGGTTPVLSSFLSHIDSRGQEPLELPVVDVTAFAADEQLVRLRAAEASAALKVRTPSTSRLAKKKKAQRLQQFRQLYALDEAQMDEVRDTIGQGNGDDSYGSDAGIPEEEAIASLRQDDQYHRADSRVSTLNADDEDDDDDTKADIVTTEQLPVGDGSNGIDDDDTGQDDLFDWAELVQEELMDYVDPDLDDISLMRKLDMEFHD